MRPRITSYRPARLGGTLFVLAGALTLVNNFAPGTENLDLGLLTVVGATAIVAGLIAWFGVPWERLDPRTSLVLPILGLGLVGISNAAAGVSGQTFSAYFVLIAAYIGASQPRWTTTWFAVPMSVVYLLALSARGATNQEFWSVTVVIPVCILVGEVLSSALAGAARAESRSSRRAELLAIAARAARTMSSLEPRRVIQGVADAGLELGYEGVAIALLNPEYDTYRIAEARNLPEEFTSARHPVDAGVTGEVVAQQAQVVFNDYRNHPRALPELRELPLQTVIGTPIWNGEKLVAVLIVASSSTLSSERAELETLVLLADQAGHALGLAERHEQERRERQRYRRESLLDELSGLGNRRRADQIVAAARPGDAIVMLDLDDFKRVNDEQGHGAGDLVIAGLGGFLRTNLRVRDSAARYGGEEFVIVLHRPGNDLAPAVERIRAGWLETHPQTSFSIGTAVVGTGEAPRRALARADAALLAAKAAGKNCARHSDADVTERAPESRPAPDANWMPAGQPLDLL